MNCWLDITIVCQHSCDLGDSTRVLIHPKDIARLPEEYAEYYRIGSQGDKLGNHSY